MLDGKVLVYGRQDDSTDYLKTAGLYDPATGRSINISSMHYIPSDHTAIALENGSVFAVDNSFEPSATGTSDLYNSSTDSYVATTKMINAHPLHLDFVQANGAVFVTAGTDDTACNNTGLCSDFSVFSSHL